MGLFGRRGRAPSAPPALPVPPFRPDIAPAEPATPFGGGDPVDALGACGVVLPGPMTPLQAATDLTVWRVPVDDGYPGLELWSAVRASHPRTGLWPVLVDNRMWEATADGLGEQPGPVTPRDGARWLQQRADELLDEVGRGQPTPWSLEPGLEFDDILAAAGLDTTGLLLVPAAGGWDVPGRLGWTGAVNHDIGGDVHTAMLRRWHGRWEIELVTMGLDTVGLRVADPPASPTEALEAAVEMTLYCPDLVFQGTTTVDALVAHAVSDAWLLWWD